MKKQSMLKVLLKSRITKLKSNLSQSDRKKLEDC